MEIKDGKIIVPNDKLYSAKQTNSDIRDSLQTQLDQLVADGKGETADAVALQKRIDQLDESISKIDVQILERESKAPASQQSGSSYHSDMSPEKYDKFGHQGKYSVKQFSYPADLLDDSYGGNYVVFYINVSNDSRLNVKENTVELDPGVEKRLRGDLVAKGMDIKTLAGANAGTQVLAGIGGGIAKVAKEGFSKNSEGNKPGFFGKAGQLAGGKETAINSGAAALGVAVAGTQAPDASRSQRRLKTAIALHIPHQLSIRYGMQWSEEDTALLQGAADAIQMAAGTAKGNRQSIGMESFMKEAGAAIALNKVQNPGAVSAALGIAANPKKEQTFKGVDFRKFTFDYQFFPRNKTEAENVLRIVNEFKLHMHPEFKSALNYIWIYPSEFDIIYYHKNEENRNIHRHTSCVLEEMNVNYTPNGAYQVFDNGMPTQINVSLGFKELQILSKETIKEGL